MTKRHRPIYHDDGLNIYEFDKSVHLGLVSAITEMLHDSYGELAKKGMKYQASHQSDEKTFYRLTQGYSYLAFIENEIVSTITLRIDTPESRIEYYRSPNVAVFAQFAVKKSHQGKKIGTKMMNLIEFEAKKRGVSYLALDTSENALDLIKMYSTRGYIKVGEHNWDFTNYKSIILSKKLE